MILPLRIAARFLLFVLCFLTFDAFAQEFTQTVRGRVIDVESQSPLPGANIIVTTTKPAQGTSSDYDGKFRLEEIPVGRHTIVVSFIGYDDFVLKEVLIGSAKEIVLTIPMTETFTTMGEVVLTDQKDNRATQNENITLSARSFSVEETKRYAASINDPARMALSYAGVSSTGDFNNEIVIRGNTPSGLLWRLEGIEIPNPNHFGEEGGSGGGVSILSANMLSNSDFLTGAFPADYGNAFSGVFDIKLRRGNNEKKEHAFQAGLLGIDFSSEGPIKKGSRSSYLINYRYSSLAILNPLIDITGDVVPTFQDAAFTFDFPTKSLGRFSLWGIGGLSEQTNDSDAFEPTAFESNMGALGLSHQYFFNQKAYLKSVVSLSGNLTSFRRDLIFGDFKILDYRNRFERVSLRYAAFYNHKINSRHSYRIGANISRTNFEVLAEGIDRDDNIFKSYLDNEGNTTLLQSYALWKHKWHKDWTLNSGLHFIYLTLNQSYSIEPRIGVKWQFSPAQSIGFATGIHSRTLTESTYFAKQWQADGTYTRVNENIELPKAIHYVFAYNRALTDKLFFKSELYYQSLYDVPIKTGDQTDPEDTAFSVLNFSSGFTTDPLNNEGTGVNYGIEFTLERPLSNGMYYMITTSLFESKYKGSDGVTHDTRYNANYVFNTLFGKEYKVGKKKNHILGVNLRTILRGGNRITPVDEEASYAAGEVKYQWDKAYTERLKDYFRIDFGISYRRNREKFSSVLSLDIQNLTNRNNIFNVDYEYNRFTNTISKEEEFQLGLIPVLNYRLEF